MISWGFFFKPNKNWGISESSEGIPTKGGFGIAHVQMPHGNRLSLIHGLVFRKHLEAPGSPLVTLPSGL